MHNPRKLLKSKSERGKRMALARWAKDRACRDADEPARLREMEIARITGDGPVEEGQYVGTLQWHGKDGIVKRWPVFRGSRSGQIWTPGVSSPKTVTWLLDRLRRHLSSYFRTGQRD